MKLEWQPYTSPCAQLTSFSKQSYIIATFIDANCDLSCPALNIYSQRVHESVSFRGRHTDWTRARDVIAPTEYWGDSPTGRRIWLEYGASAKAAFTHIYSSAHYDTLCDDGASHKLLIHTGQSAGGGASSTISLTHRNAFKGVVRWVQVSDFVSRFLSGLALA